MISCICASSLSWRLCKHQRVNKTNGAEALPWGRDLADLQEYERPNTQRKPPTIITTIMAGIIFEF